MQSTEKRPADATAEYIAQDGVLGEQSRLSLSPVSETGSCGSGFLRSAFSDLAIEANTTASPCVVILAKANPTVSPCVLFWPWAE